MANGKNNPNHPFVAKPGNEEKQAARQVQVEQRGGLYSDKIKHEPYSQMQKDGAFVPKQRMQRT